MGMNDVNIFLESGQVEEYCLGLLTEAAAAEVEAMANLHPGIKFLIDTTSRSLNKYAAGMGKTAGPALKASIWATLELIDKEENEFAQGLVPLIHQHSNRTQWLKLVKQKLPAQLPATDCSTIIRNDGQCMIIAIWGIEGMAEEEHHHAQESFLILEGECECRVGNQLIRLKAGDYYKMPMHVRHSVTVIKPLVGVLQRVKVA
ncbi:MAG: cupin domain-containing protein [Bacteroidota bacterium]